MYVRTYARRTWALNCVLCPTRIDHKNIRGEKQQTPLCRWPKAQGTERRRKCAPSSAGSVIMYARESTRVWKHYDISRHTGKLEKTQY